jgi:hypothetical protein
MEFAVKLIRAFPKMTVKAACEYAGCNRTVLYEMPEAREAISDRKANRVAAKAAVPRGFVTTSWDAYELMKSYDGIDDRQPEPLDLLIEKEEAEREAEEWLAW